MFSSKGNFSLNSRPGEKTLKPLFFIDQTGADLIKCKQHTRRTACPHGECSSRARFFHLMAPNDKINYEKPWIPIGKQIEKLKERGLLILDEQDAAQFLEHINYYRFTGYSLAFQTVTDGPSRERRFQAGVTFNDIQNIYYFDRQLRDLFSESLESIELDLRANIAYSFGEKYGAFGHTKETNFFKPSHTQENGLTHEQWLTKLRQETKRSKELFVRHFETTYCQYPDIPVWVAAEICSFGSLSQMYQGMIKKDQTGIANRYGMQAECFRSWLHHLVYIRNVCAHHARLWDKTVAIKPELPPSKIWEALAPCRHLLFTSVMIQRWMLTRCSGDLPVAQKWRTGMVLLMDDIVNRYPMVQRVMGFPENWKTSPLWN